MTSPGIEGLKTGRSFYAAMIAVFGLLLLFVVWSAGSGYKHPVLQWVADLPYGDKGAHLSLSFLLSFLVNRALLGRRLRILNGHLRRGSMIVLGLILAEEFTQLFLVRRVFSPLDILADLIGVWIGGLAADFCLRRLKHVNLNVTRLPR